MIFQPAALAVVGFCTQQIEKLGIHNRYKEVESSVCIGDNYEKRTQLIAKLVKVQLIICGYLQNLIYCKRRKSCGARN
jgi:hypothetical protein